MDLCTALHWLRSQTCTMPFRLNPPGMFSRYSDSVANRKSRKSHAAIRSLPLARNQKKSTLWNQWWGFSTSTKSPSCEIAFAKTCPARPWWPTNRCWTGALLLSSNSSPFYMHMLHEKKSYRKSMDDSSSVNLMCEPGLSQDEHMKKHIRTTHRILSEHKKPPQESETHNATTHHKKHEKYIYRNTRNTICIRNMRLIRNGRDGLGWRTWIFHQLQILCNTIAKLQKKSVSHFFRLLFQNTFWFLWKPAFFIIRKLNASRAPSPLCILFLFPLEHPSLKCTSPHLQCGLGDPDTLL